MRWAWLVLLNVIWVASAWAILTDTGVHTEPPPPVLATAGAITTDPVFGTTILRLTDANDSAQDCFTNYSNSPNLNMNSTKIYALCTVGYNRFKIWDFNATTMTRSNGRIQANTPTNFQDYGAQWSRTTYNKFYGMARLKIMETTIPDGSSTTWTNVTVKDFTSLVGAQDEAQDNGTQLSISDNDDVFAFHYRLNSVVTGYIVYKRSTDTVLLHRTTWPGTDKNEVEIDKSGRYLVVCCAPSAVIDLEANPITTTNVTTEDFNHRAMGTGIVVSGCSSSRLCKRNLATPNSVTYLITIPRVNTDFHLSLRGNDAWVETSRHTTNGQPVANFGDQEILEVSTTGNGAVRRHAHHRANVWGNDYASSPKANVSQDGQFISWSSNWEGASVSARNDVYVAKIVASTDVTPPSAPSNLRVQ